MAAQTFDFRSDHPVPSLPIGMTWLPIQATIDGSEHISEDDDKVLLTGTMPEGTYCFPTLCSGYVADLGASAWVWTLGFGTYTSSTFSVTSGKELVTGSVVGVSAGAVVFDPTPQWIDVSGLYFGLHTTTAMVTPTDGDIELVIALYRGPIIHDLSV